MVEAGNMLIWAASSSVAAHAHNVPAARSVPSIYCSCQVASWWLGGHVVPKGLFCPHTGACAVNLGMSVSLYLCVDSGAL